MKEVEAELHKARGQPELYHEVFVSKQTKKQGWECSLLVECLFSRLKTLGSILSPEKRS